MRNVFFALKFVTLCVIGFILQLFLHESGHAVIAILTGNLLTNIKFGMASYVTIEIINQWSIPVISLGSFILPIVFCLLLSILKNTSIDIVNTTILTITAIQLAINAIAILFVYDSTVLNTYDLGVYISSTNQNNIAVAIISLLAVFVMIYWITVRFKKVVAHCV